VKKQLRRASQILFLLIFFILLIKTDYSGQNEIPYPVKIFLDFDPLAFLSTLISAHSVPLMLLLSLSLVGITLALGRVFCAWVCPLGTLTNAFSFHGKKHDYSRGEKERSSRYKYLLLLFVLGGALAGIEIAGIFDPLSLIIRSLSLSIMPAADWLVRALFEPLYAMNIPLLSEISDALLSLLEKTVLPFRSVFFRQALVVGLLFTGILAASRLTTRFWCRVLCPLGALLGLLSRFQVLKLTMNDKCNGCNLCSAVCQGGARPHVRDGWSRAECLMCFNCEEECPEEALSWEFSLINTSRDRIDISKRRYVQAFGLGVVTVALQKSSASSMWTPPLLIRPPGATPEEEFLRRCIRCGECMKVCITGGLQPTLLEAGILGIWSPILVAKIGYCEFNCTLCGQVCPTGAIRELGVPEKQKTKIGLAFVDTGRCIPFAFGRPCIVCEEFCPTPKKAIYFKKIKGPTGETVNAPVVDIDLCIGCGICETMCPVNDIPAIRITSAGESRNPDRKLDLKSLAYPPG
jgi:polyferredoxin